MSSSIAETSRGEYTQSPDMACPEISVSVQVERIWMIDPVTEAAGPEEVALSSTILSSWHHGRHSLNQQTGAVFSSTSFHEWDVLSLRFSSCHEVNSVPQSPWSCFVLWFSTGTQFLVPLPVSMLEWSQPMASLLLSTGLLSSSSLQRCLESIDFFFL